MCQLDGPETFCVKLRELCQVSNCTYVSSQPARLLGKLIFNCESALICLIPLQPSYPDGRQEISYALQSESKYGASVIKQTSKFKTYARRVPLGLLVMQHHFLLGLGETCQNPARFKKSQCFQLLMALHKRAII